MLSIADHHLGRGGFGVLERVGERLLDDAVGGYVDAGREGPGFPGDADLHRQPSEGEAVHKSAQTVQAGLRGEVILIVAVGGRGEQAEQVAQLGQSTPSCPLDGLQSLAGVGRCWRAGARRGKDLTGGVGLHDHQAHVVAHDVVQFSRDPGTLGVYGGAGGIFSLPFEQPSPFAEHPPRRLARPCQSSAKDSRRNQGGPGDEPRNGGKGHTTRLAGLAAERIALRVEAATPVG